MTSPDDAVGLLRTKLAELDAADAALEARVAALETSLLPDPTPPDPAPEPDVDAYKPISYPNLQAYLDAGYGPTDARKADAKLADGSPVYVTWSKAESVTWQEFSLEDQFRLMKDGQILILPERATPYYIDATTGFMASGVDHIHDTSLPAGQQDIPIPNKYKGSGCRGWFSMARMRRGIIGLGPRSVVSPSPSSYTRPAQGDEDHLTYVQTDGASYKVNGCQERLIDVSGKENAYLGNFILRGTGKAFGEMAYVGVGMKATTVERMWFDNCWSGFSQAPNGETGAFSCTNHVIRNTTIDCAKTNNPKTSIIMANNAGSSKIEHFKATDSTGGITVWNSPTGAVMTWRDVSVPYTVNMEANGNNAGGFVLDWVGGSIGGAGFNVNVRSPYGSQRLTLKDVKNAGATSKMTFNIWGSAPYTQLKADLKCLDAAGNALPVTIGGNTAG